MKAAPVRTTSPAYPSPFTPQCPGISVAHKHPMKSVVLLRQSAAHHQLFNFAPSITQFILKKKKSTCYSQEYTNIYHSCRCSLQNQLQKLTAHYLQIQPRHIKELYHLAHCPPASVITQRCAQLAPLSLLRSPPASNPRAGSHRVFASEFQQKGVSSSCEGTSFCFQGLAETCLLHFVRCLGALPDTAQPSARRALLPCISSALCPG